MDWSNKERGQPVVKGDLADLYKAHEKSLTDIRAAIEMLVMLQISSLGLLVLFVFFPEIWKAIKIGIGAILAMKWLVL